MESNIRVRSDAFDSLMVIEQNERNWEMLCSSDKPLVPFIGAGISAWCYKTWDSLLKDVVEENFSEECSKIVVEALQHWEHKPDVEQKQAQEQRPEGEAFRWMEEIAEYIFDDDEDEFNANKNKYTLKKEAGNPQETDNDQQEANRIFENLHRYLGGYGVNTRLAAVESLYKAFGIARMKKKDKVPEYQNFFPRLFPDLLITTNYDKALERCYPSIFSYSYSDLSKENGGADKESWLYRAIEEKLDQMQARIKGIDKAAGIAVPDVPMLLKVHGSIEQASNIALSRGRYDKVYQGKMPELFGEICRRSSLLFMGCGLREDRILDELKKRKREADENDDYSFRHFAFYPIPEKEEDLKKLKNHLAEYGIYPIFYAKDAVLELSDGGETEWHSDCLGILLENLLRRKMHYHQPLEKLWGKSQFVPLEMSGSIKNAARIQSVSESAQYVHVEEASQIWELLKSSAECPLIAITGDIGSGKSTFCQNLQKLNKNPRDAMQFFYISLEDCKTWNEFCIQMYQNLNIITSGIEEMKDYLTVAKRVEQRCSGYWRSVLIFDHLDELKDEKAYPGQWDAIKKMLAYWKEHQTHVIFTTREYPKGLSCYAWHIDALTSEEAEKVFFSACTSRRHERSSLLEQHILNKLFRQQTFRPASAYLLGRYADSKNDLATLLEEWESCQQLGDSEEQTLARLMWNHLKDEHQWADLEEEEKLIVEENILWIWGILGSYPGIFPKAFLECIWSDQPGYQNKALSKKTLMFMKNAGLCEEMIDEKYGVLLNNMIGCAKHFSSRLGYTGEKRRQFNFAEDVSLDGLESFHGYTMDKYDGDLRAHILKEWKKERAQMMNPDPAPMDVPAIILDILNALGEAVKNDEKRKGHKDLNLVLHYEIKTVIRFLLAQLSRTDTGNSSMSKTDMAKIGCLFSHYYHYVPSHAFPLVQRLLEIAEGSLADCGGTDASNGFAPYEVANLNKVMGDIHRLLGQKEGAQHAYAAARQLCDRQMLLSFAGTGSDEAYRESQRIKAGILLTDNYYGSDGDGEVKEAEEIYQWLGDEWGNAYYNQRLGESVAAGELAASYEVEYFEEVRKHYNAAAEHYGKVEDMTGIAYVMKCMGDLIGEYRTIYTGQELSLWEASNGSAVYYQILASGEELPSCREIEDSREDKIYAAACCYAQAFTLYCRHINWRGFANVLQGMGNLLRYDLHEKKMTREGKGEALKPEEFKEIEELFEAAEGCYCWLGDLRGLADTLDYGGHGYKEKGGPVAEYMALGKWMESEAIWKEQGNDVKMKKTAADIRELRKKVNKDRWIENCKREDVARREGGK